MRSNKILLSAFILMSTLVNQASAIVEYGYYVMGPGLQPLDLSGPQDAMSFGNVLGYGSGTSEICNSKSVNYDIGEVIIEPLVQPIGTANYPPMGNQAAYDTGVSALSFALFVGPWGIYGDSKLKGIGTEAHTFWKGYIPNDKRNDYTYGLKVDNMTKYAKDARPFVGATSMVEKRIVRFICIDTKGVTQEIYTWSLPAWHIIGRATGCVPNESAAVIDMNKVGQTRFEDADPSRLIDTTKANFSLVCDPHIKVFVSIVDLSDMTNRSDTATLTADSTAKGVGFAVTNPGGTRMTFGVDGSYPGLPGIKQYFITLTGNAEKNPVNLNLGFSYVRKPGEDVVPGTAKALIGLTYSYQ